VANHPCPGEQCNVEPTEGLGQSLQVARELEVAVAFLPRGTDLGFRLVYSALNLTPMEKNEILLLRYEIMNKEVTRPYIKVMPSKFAKVQKQVSKKKGGALALHENSRDALRLRSAVARDDRVARLAAMREKMNDVYRTHSYMPPAHHPD
jgi:hypothetical protein